VGDVCVAVELGVTGVVEVDGDFREVADVMLDAVFGRDSGVAEGAD